MSAVTVAARGRAGRAAFTRRTQAEEHHVVEQDARRSVRERRLKSTAWAAGSANAHGRTQAEEHRVVQGSDVLDLRSDSTDRDMLV